MEVENERMVDKRELDISQWAADKKIEYLNKMGISQLICGGIRLEDRSGLHRFGIQVTSPLYGEVDTIIKEYLSGRLTLPCPRAGLRKGKRKRWL
jgi:predicted Fe-Mo cluster-binding NifX family protein